MKEDYSLLRQKIIRKLKDLSGHDFVELTPKGDAAVFDSIYLADKFYNGLAEKKRNIVLIPEEAGWLSYKEIPATLGLKAVEVKCVDGLIDINDLAD